MSRRKISTCPNNNNVSNTGTQAGQHDIVLSVESKSANVNTHTANNIRSTTTKWNFCSWRESKTDISVSEITRLTSTFRKVSVLPQIYHADYSLNGNAPHQEEKCTEVSAGNI